MAKPPKKAGKKTEKKGAAKRAQAAAPRPAVPPPLPGPDGAILDRLWATVLSRRGADPELSHSARLLARGTAKVAQKFGEEAVEAVIEATRGNRSALIGESADVLYHLMVVLVDAGIRPEEVWAELERREAMSGIDEKASRARPLTLSAVARRLPPRGRSTKLW